MKKIINYIICNGIEDDMSYGEQAKIKLINISIVLAISNILIYDFVYLMIDPIIGNKIIFSGSFFVVPIIISIYLIKKKRYLIAKNLFLSASTLVILFTAKVYLGPDFGFQTYLLIFIVMPYVAFSNKERFFSFFYSIANMIFFYYIQYGNYDFFMKTNSEFYESGIPHVFNVITTLTAFSTVIIIMIILNNIISANEKILKEALGKANYYADYDHLTGIYNRRKTSKILEEKCKSFLEEENFVVVMCDIDHFKKINDYYGHPAGDVIIKEVTEVIASKLRKHDALGRWGGEEFLIIISNINLNQGISLVEEIRREIEKKIFHLDIRVTMSFGLAEYSSDKNSQTIISEADNFMYFAKENGRNQIMYKKY